MHQRPHLPPDWYYDTDSYTDCPACPDPYDTAPDTPAPQSVHEAYRAYADAKKRSIAPVTMHTVPYVDASMRQSSHQDMIVTADISGIPSEHGSGVYAIMVWGTHGTDIVIAQYLIFYSLPA